MTPDPDKSGKLFYDPSIKNWDYGSEKKNRENELWKLRKNIQEDSKKNGRKFAKPKTEA